MTDNIILSFKIIEIFFSRDLTFGTTALSLQVCASNFKILLLMIIE